MLLRQHHVFGLPQHAVSCKAGDQQRAPGAAADQLASMCLCEGVDALIVYSPRAAQELSDAVGKWCAFPNDSDEADDAWESVRASTVAGELGFAAKFSLKERKKPAIMVYCEKGVKDAISVSFLEKLARAGAQLKQLFFKLDSATEQGLYSVASGGRGGVGHIDGAPAPVITAVAFGSAPRQCINWKNTGTCNWGDACEYLHEKDGCDDFDWRLARVDCNVCLMSREATRGVRCSAQHFTCHGCVKTSWRDRVRMREGRAVIKCCDDAEPWTVADLAHIVPGKEIARKLDEHITAQEQKIKDMEAVFLDAAAARDAVLAGKLKDRAKEADPVPKMRELIVEALNPVCPRCKRAVVRVEGCDAMTCECGAKFCGLCFEDCGDDAHPHLLTTHTKMLKNTDSDRLKFHKARAVRIVRGALNTVFLSYPDLEPQLLVALQTDLRGLDIAEADVSPDGNVGSVGRTPPPGITLVQGSWRCASCDIPNLPTAEYCRGCLAQRSGVQWLLWAQN
jgi:hypothetical protein